jgi:type I restriction enzyme, S subunit
MSFQTRRISELFTNIKIGGTPSRGNTAFFGGENLWVSIRDMERQSVITKTAETISDEGARNSNCKLVKKGSLLFSFKLTVGRVSFAGADLYTNEAIAAFDRDEAELAGIDLEYLSLVLPIAASQDTTKNSMGVALLNKEKIFNLEVPIPGCDEQRQIATRLKDQLAEVETARQAGQTQLQELTHLANAIISESIQRGGASPHFLGDVLVEVKKGIGSNWASYPVLGATRGGLAPAREQPGKLAPKYKPAFPGTVFYNPMRILIGSIAYVDDDDTPGITSPDYVALQGKAGFVDSRWFYYWLRSPLGAHCILSLARGAVRERMLFNRLAEGKIELPSFSAQESASHVLRELKSLRIAMARKLADINLLPQKILAQVFNPRGDNHGR